MKVGKGDPVKILIDKELWLQSSAVWNATLNRAVGSKAIFSSKFMFYTLRHGKFDNVPDLFKAFNVIWKSN